MRLVKLLLVSVLMFACPQARASELFAELGGRAGVEQIVEAATAIWTSDPRIASTFEETNIPRFKRLLVEQLCQVSGGGCPYSGRDMREAHKGLHLITRQFNILVEDLQQGMDRVHVPFPAQSRLIALLAPMYHVVVTQ